MYVYQLVRYARACGKYQYIVDRGKLLTIKLLSQGYLRAKLMSTVKNSIGDIMTSLMPFLNLFSDLMASVEA